MALELALEKAGVELLRAKVGDRYVLQGLEEKGWSIGGEPSGHILTFRQEHHRRCDYCCAASLNRDGRAEESTARVSS